MILMSTAPIIPASALRPGLATFIVSLPDRTIRSCVFMVQVWPHGVVPGEHWEGGEMMRGGDLGRILTASEPSGRARPGRARPRAAPRVVTPPHMSLGTSRELSDDIARPSENDARAAENVFGPLRPPFFPTFSRLLGRPGWSPGARTRRRPPLAAAAA